MAAQDSGRIAFRAKVSLALALIVTNAALADVPIRKENKKPTPALDIFADGHIPALRLEINGQGMDSLRRSPRTYVSATVREGTMAYTNVAIHLKGGPGSFRKLDDYPAFTLNFDRFAEGQRFHGLKKIHLNNSVQDRTYLSEKISRELFEAAGVPAPRAGHAGVTLNGEGLGLYVLVEGVNKQFLGRYFKDTSGNVYQGHPGSDITRRLPTNSGDKPRDQSRLRTLVAAASEPDLAVRMASLEKILDVDRFISFIAMEVILGHWDGYTLGRNNFRVFHDRETDRLVFLPHGLDQTLQQQTPIIPNPNGSVARALLEIPEARRRYTERVSQLLTNVFKVDAITKHVHEVADRVHAVLEKIDPEEAKNYPQLVQQYCRRVQRRAMSLEHQFTFPSSASQFDNAGFMAVTNWVQTVEVGKAALTQEKDQAGRTLLHIRTEENGAASWRSRVRLERGQYRFQGKLKIQGIVLASDDPRAGVGLRISRRKFPRKLSGDADWSSAAFDFEVQQDQSDVELVCELRAAQGDAWFDLKTLRVIRR
jgi:hypothetical protein